MKGDYEEFHALKAAKKQSQSKPISSAKRAFAYGARDCHGPSGLAMTSISLLLCALVALWLWYNLKKQSQFVDAEISASTVITKYYGHIVLFSGHENKAKQSQF